MTDLALTLSAVSAGGVSSAKSVEPRPLASSNPAAPPRPRRIASRREIRPASLEP